MAGGGELRAFFKGAQEDTAQAVESVAHKMASFGEQTARNVRDSVTTLRNAESANTEAINGIRGRLGGDEGGSGAAPEGGASRIASMLTGEGGAAGEAAGGPLKWTRDYTVNHSIDRTLERVNPKYNPAESAYSENCTGVVQANELTRRGIPSEAGPLEEPLRKDQGGPGGRSAEVIEDAWGRKFKPGTKADIQEAFSQPGSRGVVYVQWKPPMEGAHVFNVENVGGEVRFVDGQPIPPLTDASHYFDVGHNTGYLRLDDLPTPGKDAVRPYLENDGS